MDETLIERARLQAADRRLDDIFEMLAKLAFEVQEIRSQLGPTTRQAKPKPVDG